MAELKNEERIQCEKVFNHFDSNKDGKISWEELAKALKALGLGSSEEEVRDRMKEIDGDNDGFISFDELFAFQCAHPDLMKNVSDKL
ncbi:hypothetical protein CsatB_001399 [Cannabis sativa]|uniref:EF-hand domain-containing protein n=2 Tax=Cannabis sativa TaxID=3483 RepID=A0AB40E6X9_CANSA|nr:hypothetical protein F8388_019756 [Cannabis sativa]KAF4400355.1 hypothetical protein G4B88_018697 [Cannabis sativa]